jgi:hypothetical protein
MFVISPLISNTVVPIIKTVNLLLLFVFLQHEALFADSGGEGGSGGQPNILPFLNIWGKGTGWGTRGKNILNINIKT